jgi:16S rRNA (guanine(966)-N(2))-methyltransferase RsmD
MRVIAGWSKGRRLTPPDWAGLRPTSDRTRETLFNIVAPRMVGATVMDGFAGTGAVGIEALSRGAAHVTFIESDRRACALIAANVARCGVMDGYNILSGDLVQILEGGWLRQLFDVIILDPPYTASGVSVVLAAAAEHLAAGGLLVLERATRGGLPDLGQLAHVRDVRSGESTLTFAERIA